MIIYPLLLPDCMDNICYTILFCGAFLLQETLMCIQRPKGCFQIHVKKPRYGLHAQPD